MASRSSELRRVAEWRLQRADAGPEEGDDVLMVGASPDDPWPTRRRLVEPGNQVVSHIGEVVGDRGPDDRPLAVVGVRGRVRVEHLAIPVPVSEAPVDTLSAHVTEIGTLELWGSARSPGSGPRPPTSLPWAPRLPTGHSESPSWPPPSSGRSRTLVPRDPRSLREREAIGIESIPQGVPPPPRRAGEAVGVPHPGPLADSRGARPAVTSRSVEAARAGDAWDRTRWCH